MGSFRFPVEAGHVLMFARAIGDDDPAYGASDALAPPTFAQASAQFNPDYRLRPKPGQKWYGSAGGPGTLPEGAGGLHAEQHFTYHRPVRVGDVFAVTSREGDSWEKRGRSGRLVFTEHITEYRDQAGELVVTARAVGVVQHPDPEGHRS